MVIGSKRDHATWAAVALLSLTACRGRAESETTATTVRPGGSGGSGAATPAWDGGSGGNNGATDSGSAWPAGDSGHGGASPAKDGGTGADHEAGGWTMADAATDGNDHGGAGGAAGSAGVPSGYPDGGMPTPGLGGCSMSYPCPAGQLCNYAIAGCNCGALGKSLCSGVCSIPPTVCTSDCPGVCGCDGRWYCNECLANAAGVSIGAKYFCPDAGGM